MNACTGQNGTAVARQKDNESDEVSWGEFLRVIIIGEYNVRYCWPLIFQSMHVRFICRKRR